MAVLDLFRRRRTAAPGAAEQEITVTVMAGRETLHVVGESHYQDALWHLCGQVPGGEKVNHRIHAMLVPEPTNPYDANAIAVNIGGYTVGYLDRGTAEAYLPSLTALIEAHDTPIALVGAIAGGGMRDDGPGRLGVFLEHDPRDFGAEPIAPVPMDDRREIERMRSKMASSQDAVDRHYLFNDLEARLYRCRETFPTAFDEFDKACERHDREMDQIIPALLAKFGDIPMLPTYKQMCIRQQKAGNWAACLWWAERGIAVYGSDAHWQGWIEDLAKRRDRARVALGQEVS